MTRMEPVVRAIFLKDERLRPVIRCVVYIVLTMVCAELIAAVGGMAAIVAGVRPSDLEGGSSFPALLISELGLCAAAVGVAILLRRRLDRRSVASLGLSLQSRWPRLLLTGIALGAGMQAVIFAVDTALGYSRVISFAPASADAFELLQYVPVFAAVAVAEETFARGYLFQNLWEEWGVAAAVVITSAIFAAGHLDNPNSHAQLTLTICGLLAYGIWASLSVLWTRSLWLVIGVHFAWNLFEGPVFGFPVSGVSLGTPAITQSVAGPAWFTGGSFGPEAGASSLFALAAGLGALFWLYRSGVFPATADAREAYALGPRGAEAQTKR